MKHFAWNDTGNVALNQKRRWNVFGWIGWPYSSYWSFGFLLSRQTYQDNRVDLSIRLGFFEISGWVRFGEIR